MVSGRCQLLGGGPGENVSGGDRKVSDVVRKVSDVVRKGSHGVRNLFGMCHLVSLGRSQMVSPRCQMVSQMLLKVTVKLKIIFLHKSKEFCNKFIILSVVSCQKPPG